MVEYEKTVAQLKAGEKLTEDEIKNLMYSADFIDEIEGETHRWYREVKSIIVINGELYAVDWNCGLTEYQENEYPNQPYRVTKKEKQITVAYYERIEESAND